jgi:hypothetical protein
VGTAVLRACLCELLVLTAKATSTFADQPMTQWTHAHVAEFVLSCTVARNSKRWASLAEFVHKVQVSGVELVGCRTVGDVQGVFNSGETGPPDPALSRSEAGCILAKLNDGAHCYKSPCNRASDAAAS